MAENLRNNTYVYGSAAPQYYPEETTSYDAQREQREANERERARKRKRLEREKKKSRLNCVAMIGVTTMVLALSVLYIRLQSDFNSKMNRIAKLEGELLTLTEANDATYKRIETGINLEEIKKIAVNELKMVYPKESQIEYYHIDKTDYMEQYKDIPTGNEGTIFGMMFEE